MSGRKPRRLTAGALFARAEKIGRQTGVPLAFERSILTKAKSCEYEQKYRLCPIEFASEVARDLGMRWNRSIGTASVDAV